MGAAGAIKGGEAYVQAFLDDNPITQGLAKLKGKLLSWQSGLGSLGAKAYGGTLPGPIGAMMRFATSPAGAFSGMLAAAVSTANASHELEELSSKTGISISTLSSLGYAARHSGVGVEQLAHAIARMQRTFAGAAMGGGEAAQALGRLGLSVADMKGQDPSGQFRMIADRIAGIQDPAMKTAMAMKIFGRSGAELLPLLNKGAKGIEELEKRAGELGLIKNAQQVKDNAAFVDTMKDLQDVVKGSVTAIGSALTPILNSLTPIITGIAGAVRDWIKSHQSLVFGIFAATGVIVGLGIALKVASLAFGVLGGVVAIVKGIFAVASVVIGIANAIIAASGAIVTLVTTPWVVLGLVIGAVVIAGVALMAYFSGALSGWGAAFGKLGTDATDAFGSIQDALAAGKITEAMKVLTASLKLMWAEMIEFLMEKMGQFSGTVQTVMLTPAGKWLYHKGIEGATGVNPDEQAETDKENRSAQVARLRREFEAAKSEAAIAAAKAREEAARGGGLGMDLGVGAVGTFSGAAAGMMFGGSGTDPVVAAVERQVGIQQAQLDFLKSIDNHVAGGGLD